MSELAEHAKNEPDLRFPEFDGAWEGKTLRDFFTFKNGINADKSMYGYGQKFINVLDIINEHPILHNSIIGSVSVSETEFQKNEVIYGDILFQRSSETREEVGQSNVYLDREQSATFGGFVIRGRPIAKFNSSYFNLLLKTQAARKDMTAKSGGSTRYNVGQEALSEVKVTVASSTAEQQKIASFLSAVDEKITQLEEKKNLLEDYKKGCMQQLFSQALRFKDEDGNDYPDWEEKRLGEVGDLKNGFNAAKDAYGSGTSFINLMDIFGISSVSILDLGRVEASQKDIDTYSVRRGDILFVRSSVKRDGVGQACLVDVELSETLYSGFIIRLRFYNELITHDFKKYCFSHRGIRKQILAVATSSANTNVNQENLELIKLEVPHPDEQQKIADFLSVLDDKITHATTQLEQTKTFKKGLLQKMFV